MHVTVQNRYEELQEKIRLRHAAQSPAVETVKKMNREICLNMRRLFVAYVDYSGFQSDDERQSLTVKMLEVLQSADTALGTDEAVFADEKQANIRQSVRQHITMLEQVKSGVPLGDVLAKAVAQVSEEHDS